ncbi:MAG: hypothetical protein II621_08820 [Clostridia bacterium]|nr:hypothetical protein [Clostridia bacterium]
MKKIVSTLLALVLILSVLPLAIQAHAANPYRFDLPTVYFRGNGEPIVDEDGNTVYDFDVSTDQIKEIAAKVLPLLLAGMIGEKVTGPSAYDEYYKVFGEEMSKIYDRCQLDENGNPKYGTGISAKNKADNEVMRHENRADRNGQFGDMDYQFNNDWRLDPFDTVDAIDAFIDDILEATDKDKVNLLCTCLGGDLVLAYIAKYGTAKINGIGFQQTVAFGAELVDETFSGHMNLDPDAIQRFVQDDFLREKMAGLGDVLFTFLNETVELMQDGGVLQGVSGVFMDKLYNKLYEGLVPELVLATYGTWPGYWTMVTADHYASTRDFIFGEPGSEKYEQYKGLIAKLDNYDAEVRQQIPTLLQQAKDDGHPIAITVYYGDQMPPILESADEQGDVWTTVRYASLGATAAKIGTTLTDDYIAERTAAGYGAYISPDKIIDASTAVFPDTTWFIKGAIHNDKGVKSYRLYAPTFNRGATVQTVEGFPQFLVYDRTALTLSPMTEENMNTEKYDTTPKPTGRFDRLLAFFKHLLSWFKSLFTIIKNR